jgi:hypothetical protein
LTDLVGTSSSDLWASGEGRLLLHWDGTTYTARSTPTPGNIRALWSAGADDIWGVGDGGAIIHRDGQTWTRICSPVQQNLMDVSGTGPEDIWAVGPEADGFLHFDGKEWAVVQPCLPDGRRRQMTHVFAISRDDVWFAGNDGWVIHWDGVTWTETQLSYPAKPLTRTLSLWGTGPDNLWVRSLCMMDAPCEVAYQWDGKSWSRAGGRVGLEGTAPNNGWAREGGALLHWNGTSWTSMVGGGRGLLLATAEGYHVGDHHQILRLSEGQWLPLDGTRRNLYLPEIRAIAQEGTDEALAVGGISGRGSYVVAMRWDGSRWDSSYVGPPGTVLWGPFNQTLTTVDITGPGQAWASGTNDVLHREGTVWSKVSLPWRFADVWGAAPDDVWAVRGDADALVHYDGAQWLYTSYSGVAHVQGSSARNVWAVGNGSTWRWDGTSWAFHTTPSTRTRFGLWVGAEDDAWMSADNGWMTHWDGVAWTDVVTGASARLGHVTGSGRNDVWVVSGTQGLLHWDGTAWSSHEPPVRMTFHTVASRAPGEVWVGTNLGILRFAP